MLPLRRQGARQPGDCAALQLPKSTVSRLTSTLTRLGYMVQIEDSGKYRLGTATLSLGSAMLAHHRGLGVTCSFGE